MLDTTSVPFSLRYLNDPTGDIALAFACEIDVAVQINPEANSALKSVGVLISYADPADVNGSEVCYDDFQLESGNTACIQAGYDSGISKTYSQRRSGFGPNNAAPGLMVGQSCKQGGA